MEQHQNHILFQYFLNLLSSENVHVVYLPLKSMLFYFFSRYVIRKITENIRSVLESLNASKFSLSRSGSRPRKITEKLRSGTCTSTCKRSLLPQNVFSQLMYGRLMIQFFSRRVLQLFYANGTKTILMFNKSFV